MDRILVGLITVCLCMLLPGCATAPEKVKVIGETQTIGMAMTSSPEGTLDLGFGTCQWLYPHDKPQEALENEPKYGSVNPIYYAATFGDAKDNTYTFVLDESSGTGTGYDRVYVDLDNDNRLDASRENFSVQLSGLTQDEEKPLRVTLLVRAAGEVINYSFSFTAFHYSDENKPEKRIHANARNSAYYLGEAVINGQRRKIALADLNSNGLFNDPEPHLFGGDRFFVDLDGDGKFRDSSPRWEESLPYGKYTRLGNEWYSIAATPEGKSLKIAKVEPPLGTVEGPPENCGLVLRSDSQSLWLDFSKGRAAAIVGTYRPASVYLNWDNGSDREQRLSGTFLENAGKIVVRKGETTTLRAGPPLQVEITTSRAKDPDCVGLDLQVTGQGGEAYRVREARFEIQDEHGEVVASAPFEYG